MATREYFLSSYGVGANVGVDMFVFDSTGVNTGGYSLSISPDGDDTNEDFKVKVQTAAAAYRTAHSLPTPASVVWLGLLLPGGLSGAPLTTIADATGGVATNLATNYNLATGILGLATALNAANAAQNDLGTKFNALVVLFNALLVQNRTLGLTV